MTFHEAALVPALLCLFAVNSIAQTPPAAAPPAVPADVSPLYVVTYVETKPTARDETAALLKSYRGVSRSAPGNVRFEIVQQTNRPNHFTVFEIWRSREAFDANGMSAYQREFRDKLAGMAGALYDERLYEILN